MQFKYCRTFFESNLGCQECCMGEAIRKKEPGLYSLIIFIILMLFIKDSYTHTHTSLIHIIPVPHKNYSWAN